jgi:UPF0176 protein
MPRMSFSVAAFYKFSKQPNFRSLQRPVLDALNALHVKGNVLLAAEGINGTIAASEHSIHKALEALRNMTDVQDLDVKLSQTKQMPFKRMKVRLKREIVTIGDVSADPTENVGTYVEPEDWNTLISNPDVVVIDTRNAYEVQVGTFEGAVDPQTDQFSDFPSFVREKLQGHKDKTIAMFCTGGIRCEKASSFMINEGFKSVFHLKGGILKYLETVPRSNSLWNGECFVFDERVAVGHGLMQGTHSICHGCIMPVSAADRLSKQYEEGVSCPACFESLTDEQIASNRERQKQFILSLKTGVKHLGPKD